jgi:hypothetical protein
MSAPGARPIKILLVEDNPGDARLAEVLLSEAASSAEFEVVRAVTLGEALVRSRTALSLLRFPERYERGMPRPRDWTISLKSCGRLEVVRASS